MGEKLAKYLNQRQQQFNFRRNFLKSKFDTTFFFQNIFQQKKRLKISKKSFAFGQISFLNTCDISYFSEFNDLSLGEILANMPILDYTTDQLVCDIFVLPNKILNLW